MGKNLKNQLNTNNNVIDENKKRHSQELLNKKTVSSDDILKLILNIKDSKFYIGFCNKSNLKVYEEVLKLLEKQEEERNFLFSKDNIPLNPYLIVKLINNYNFQIYLLNKEDVESNINTEKEIIYINEAHLSEKIDFYFIDEFKTNYNFYQKTLFINKNDVINDLS
ncbi:MAG: hypothetical protein U9532_00840 ['Conium maculatum' witches'-broom phytoplasma]|nr:hypothetical protein ['Conium maculatum' witches'-broom phytoplasma]